MHPERISIPTTCDNNIHMASSNSQNQLQLDFIGGTLYGTVPDQCLQAVIEDSAARMAKQSNSEEPYKIAQLARQNGRLARIAAFFALLNYDSELKTQLRDLGERRAEGFYYGMRERAIAKWLENEAFGLHNLIEQLRFEYRNA